MKEITIEEYADAVKILIPLAQGDTGGSRVAAQVLLSAYRVILHKGTKRATYGFA